MTTPKQEVVACKACIRSAFWDSFKLNSFKAECEICKKKRKCIFTNRNKLLRTSLIVKIHNSTIRNKTKYHDMLMC